MGYIMVTDNGTFDMYPYLHLIIVHRDYRGKGYGSTLMEYYEDVFYPQSRKLFLLVGGFNMEAIKLYERLGYIKCGEIDGFYNPILIILMRMVAGLRLSILMAYPHAKIYSMDNNFELINYKDTEHYQMMSNFINNKDKMLDILLEE